MDLEPCSFSRFTCLADREANDTEDLIGKEQPKTGVHVIFTFEYPFLCIHGYADTVIFAEDDYPVITLCE